jgi:hypothetical protein
MACLKIFFLAMVLLVVLSSIGKFHVEIYDFKTIMNPMEVKNYLQNSQSDYFCFVSNNGLCRLDTFASTYAINIPLTVQSNSKELRCGAVCGYFGNHNPSRWNMLNEYELQWVKK